MTSKIGQIKNMHFKVHGMLQFQNFQENKKQNLFHAVAVQLSLKQKSDKPNTKTFCFRTFMLICQVTFHSNCYVDNINCIKKLIKHTTRIYTSNLRFLDTEFGWCNIKIYEHKGSGRDHVSNEV